MSILIILLFYNFSLILYSSTPRYSGLTAEKLENVTTKVVDIQRKLSELMDYNTILLGHSLECDLRVLKVRTFFILPLIPG